ncbi:hypothetical protein LJB88_02985 [Erysipelotrichaceae bacterium OttesenSCG-928-M19]|nr:hypothetical protein [Erysipelotrichaceae bacterium OttesenSCG-928-M19]
MKKIILVLMLVFMYSCSSNNIIKLADNITVEELQEKVKKTEYGVVVVANQEAEETQKVVTKLAENNELDIYTLDKPKEEKFILNVIEDKEIETNIVIDSKEEINEDKITNYVNKKVTDAQNKTKYTLTKDHLMLLKDAEDLTSFEEIKNYNDSKDYFKKLLGDDSATKEQPLVYVKGVANKNFSLVDNSKNYYNEYDGYDMNKSGADYKVEKYGDLLKGNLKITSAEGEEIIKFEDKYSHAELYNNNNSRYSYIIIHQMEPVLRVYMIDKLNNKAYIVNQLSYFTNERAYLQYQNMFGVYDYQDETFYCLVETVKEGDNYTNSNTTQLAYLGFTDAYMQISPNTMFFFELILNNETYEMQYEFNDIASYLEQEGINLGDK